MVTYETIYDVRQTGYGFSPLYWALLLGMFFSICVGVLWMSWSGRWLRATSYLVLACFFAFLIYCEFWGPIYNKWQCIQWAKSGDTQIVEGIVQDFRPQPREGHAAESFTVGGKTFYYSYFTVDTGSYSKSSPYGGVVREGLVVRITYHEVSPVDRRILVLEVAK